jgi:hypothetical protein
MQDSMKQERTPENSPMQDEHEQERTPGPPRGVRKLEGVHFTCRKVTPNSGWAEGGNVVLQA